jgi:hypothetical protein
VCLAIWTSSFEKVLFTSVAHFFIGSLIFDDGEKTAFLTNVARKSGYLPAEN